MTEPRETEAAVPSDLDVWAAVSVFQKILEVMPNDRASLDGLAHAFEQIGDHTQAREYLLRLGEVLLAERDTQAARRLLDRLESYAADQRAAELIARIRALPGDEPTEKPADSGTPQKPSSQDTARAAPISVSMPAVNIAEEMSCAWNLLQAGELTQDQYAGVVHDLTEMSVAEAKVTVSVLHVLEARNFKRMEKVINFLETTCGTPFLSVTSFEIPREAASLLPMDYMIRRGVLIFDLVGDQALAVVMNPYDQGLRQEVERLIGKKTHFFITMPSEFDAVLTRLQDAQPDGRANP